MKPGRLLALALAPGLALGLACAPPTARLAYDWGSQEGALQALMKHPGGLPAYGATLKRQLERNPDGQRVPPGLYAEYGTFLWAEGHPAEAAEWFAKEKARWPEAAKFMDRMIAACAPPAPGPGGALP